MDGFVDGPTANFVRDVVAARPPGERAVVTIDAAGTRREWTFGELTAGAIEWSARLHALGARRGSVVMLLVGSTIEYVLATLGCLRIGAVALPCSEQLRAKDLTLRIERARPAVIVCAERNRAELDRSGSDIPVITVGPLLPGWVGEPPPVADLGPLDPAFVLFTSGTSGAPKLVTHGQRYVWGQRLQATEWMAARPGELVWSTAAPGWSKSARNTFIAPWMCGAAGLLVDRRFDPQERVATVRAEGVDVLCMAPTEYRLIAAAAGPIGDLGRLRRAITAGEPLGAPAWQTWREQTGLAIADGYGQTETGHLTAVQPGDNAPPGSMGRTLPGISARIVDGELQVDPATVPTFFLGYDGRPPPPGWWHTGDRVREDDDGWLYFEARVDDVILSAGYRIGPAEVESTLLGHPSVAEVAVIGVPDPQRGERVCAVVVLAHGHSASPELTTELQAFVREQTAPYKYPREIVYVDALPKTTSGKIHRTAVRSEHAGRT